MRFWMLLCFAGLMFGQGTEPKHKAEDYELHAQAKDVAIGAEFMVHSFSRGEQSYLAQDYLVVEIALFPPKDTNITVQSSDFSMRINGKKQVLTPASPSMVVSSLQHPEWEQQGGIRPTIGAGVGNTGVILGGPPRDPNVPGTAPPGTTPPSRVPIPRDNPSGVEKPKVDVGQLLMETSLQEGPHHSATSGFLYFYYHGKMSSIKTLELIYKDTVLKLR